MIGSAANFPAELHTLAAQVCVRLDWLNAWGNPIERHAALEEVGVVFVRHLERAMAEAAVARAVLDQPRR